MAAELVAESITLRATWDKLWAYCDQLVTRFHPKQIILFGSFGTERQRADSDIDLLLILPLRVAHFGKPLKCWMR